jgi:hypothetical protein
LVRFCYVWLDLVIFWLGLVRFGYVLLGLVKLGYFGNVWLGLVKFV